MVKKIVFTIILLMICGGSFYFGIYTFGLSNDPKSHELLPDENAENAEDSEEAVAVPFVREKGPIATFLFPDMDTETGVQKALTEKSREVLSVWAALKVINGVINVLQSAQIGGSFFVEASVNPLEFLSPIDNVLDKISDILLWAFGAIIFEKILLVISGYIVFIVVIPLCSIISIIILWTNKDRSKTVRVLIVSVLISLVIPFAIPVSFQASALLENKILTNNVGDLVASIEEKNSKAENMEQEITGLARIGKTIISYMANAKDLGNAMIEDMINYVIIFIFTNIVIPLFTIMGLFFLTRYFVRLILAG